MLKLKGLGVSSGIVTGPVLILYVSEQSIPDVITVEDKSELERFEKALKRTETEIQIIKGKLEKQEISESEIFNAYLLILEDDEFTGTVKALISEKSIKAERAIEDTVQKLSTTLRGVKSEYISSRAKDIEDLGNQLIKNMTSQVELRESQTKPSIIIAKDLKASETARLDKETVLGIITEEGSPISHASILARALRIPAVVKCRNLLDKVKTGDMVVLNGSTGEVLINP
jgi:phosphotransferase system enzyme I (PtsI)